MTKKDAEVLRCLEYELAEVWEVAGENSPLLPPGSVHQERLPGGGDLVRVLEETSLLQAGLPGYFRG